MNLKYSTLGIHIWHSKHDHSSPEVMNCGSVRGNVNTGLLYEILFS